MSEVYLESERVPGRRFRVLSVDKETMKATLQGDGVEFEFDVRPSVLKVVGYRVVKVMEGDHAKQ